MRIATIILLLAIAPCTFGNEHFVVTASSLNVRQSPSANSPTIGKLASGDTISVSAIDGNWAKCDNGYVNTAYLERVVVESENINDLSNLSGSPDTVWILVGLIALMWFNNKFIRKISSDDELDINDGKFSIVFNGLLTYALSFSVLYYVWQLKLDSLWFIMPSMCGGWVNAIINGIALLYFTLNYMVGIYLLLCDITKSVDYNYPINNGLRFGLAAWAIGVSACLLCYWLYPENVAWAVGFTILLQLSMAFYFIGSLRNYGSISTGFFVAISYLICTTAFITLLCTAVAIIIALILAIVACIIGLKITHSFLASGVGTQGGRQPFTSSMDGIGKFYGDYIVTTRGEYKHGTLSSGAMGDYFWTPDGSRWRIEGDNAYLES